MALSRTRLLATLVAGGISLLASGTAQAIGVTGISDQHMADRNAGLGYWTETADAFQAVLTAETGSNGARIAQARYMTPWNVTSLPDEATKLDAWLDAATRKGLTPLVSFQPAPGQTRNPDAATYARAMAAFRATARWSSINEFTAWNEPNHGSTWVDAAPAAAYYDALVTVCNGTCTVAAGDFAGGYSTTYTKDYIENYVAALRTLGRNPNLWAYHPYEIVNYLDGDLPSGGRYTGLRWFFDAIGNGKRVWLTEVNAYYCQRQTYYGPTLQNAGAQRLETLIHSATPFSTYSASLERVYWYALTDDYHPSSPGVPASPCNHDGGLINHVLVDGGGPRPAMYTLFPQAAGHWWLVRNDNSAGNSDFQFAFSGTGTPVVGDWNRDRADSPGTFNRTTALWSLRNPIYSGGAENAFNFGIAGDVPVSGDWDGDGADSPGLYRPSTGTWYLRNAHSCCNADIVTVFGIPGAIPVVGDWNGDRIDTPGLFEPTTAHWYMRDDFAGGNSTIDFVYGGAGDTPVVGNWDGLGGDSIGVWRAGHWYLRNSNSTGISDRDFLFGLATEPKVVVGDWDGDGDDTPGIVR